MSEVKNLKAALIEQVREGTIAPKDAVAEFEKLTPTQIRTGRVYEQKSVDDRRDQYRKAREIRKAIRSRKTPFISPKFLPNFWLCQGLIVVGAESGRAKSTTCSATLLGFLESDKDRTAIVISNEEATDAVYDRTACMALKKSFVRYSNGDVPPREEREIAEFVEEIIIPRVEVIEDAKYDMSYLEDVQSVLETAALNRVGIVLVDYLQVITQSRKDPNLESFQVSKRLGLYLKEYGKNHGIPVVCFVQLHSSSKGPTMAERIQNDKTFFNHGFICIEVVPDFETLTTKFKVHKDRFGGHTGKEITCEYKDGRYVFPGDESL
jgi:replicative DNA helicase